MVKVERKKIENLSFMKNPTGTVQIPLSALRTKAMKEKTSSNEETGHAEENELDLNGFSDDKGDLDSVSVYK